jgi:hypothetical protein
MDNSFGSTWRDLTPKFMETGSLSGNVASHAESNAAECPRLAPCRVDLGTKWRYFAAISRATAAWLRDVAVIETVDGTSWREGSVP